MKASFLYRIVSALLVLFAIGHTLGFRQVDPSWRVDSAVGALKSARFEVQGFSRTYWDFYTGFGLLVTQSGIFCRGFLNRPPYGFLEARVDFDRSRSTW